MRTRTKKVTPGDVEATLGSLPSDESATEPKPAPEKKATTPRRGSMERQLRDLFETISGALILKGDLVCGQVVKAQAPEMAKAWDNLASQNRVIQKWMETLTTGGAAAEVLTSMFPVFMVAGLHHGPDPARAAAMGLPDHRPFRIFAQEKPTQVIQDVPFSTNGTGEANMEDVIPVS